jgi:hypothetical protein
MPASNSRSSPSYSGVKDVEYGTEKLIFAPFLGHSVQTREHVKRG